MKARKMAWILAAGLSAAMLGGCSGASSETEAAQTAAESGQSEAGTEAAAQTAEAFSYPMEEGEPLTYWKELNNNIALEFTTLNDTPFAQGMTERTGIEVDYQHPPAGQAQEQFGLLLADGNFPDIIEYNWLKSYSGGPQKAIEDGVILRLNDIMDQYCPNLKAYLEENPEIDKMVRTDEGDYYAFPMIRPNEAETVQIGPMMRGDWLEELNLEVPTTVEEWRTVLTAFKEEKGAIAPLSYNYSDGNIRKVNPVAMAYVPSVDFYLAEDGTVHYGSIEEGYKNYLETFAQWYAEGLVDVDLVSLKADQVTAKMTSGQAGASVGRVEGQLGSWYTAGRKNEEGFTLIGVPWPTVEEGAHPQGGYCENLYSGISSAAISTSCKDVERAARLLDWAFSEEGNLYVNFGQEGITYEMVDGEPQFTDEILNNPNGWTKKTAQGAYTLGLGGPVVKDPRVGEQTMDIPEQREARYEIWSDSDMRNYLLPPITPNSEESREFSTIMNEIETYRDEMTIKYIMGQESLDTFDEYVANIQTLGIDRAIEIQTAALERYNAR